MITVDLNAAIAVFLSFCLLLVFGAWVSYNFNNRTKNYPDDTDVVQCPYCMHFFSESRKENMIRCPCCKSIIEINQNQIKNQKNNDPSS